MKTTKFLLVMLFSIAVAACGGGGSSTPTSTTSGTAAQYFTKTAVGNTWSWLRSSTKPSDPISEVRTITASTGGVVTYSSIQTYTGGPSAPTQITVHIDVTGAMVSDDGTNTYLDLPATFMVGTTWVTSLANPATGESAFNSTIAAFNVTRTVPAGTFTDCLQINSTWSHTSAGVTTSYNDTIYISPTAGDTVEETGTYSSSDGTTGTFNRKLQAGYIANP